MCVYMCMLLYTRLAEGRGSRTAERRTMSEYLSIYLCVYIYIHVCVYVFMFMMCFYC